LNPGHDVQASLFSPTGPVMLRALCRQIETRVSKIEAYLTRNESTAVYAELSLAAIVLDKIERRVETSQAYRDAQLAPLVVPIEKVRQVVDSPAVRLRALRRKKAGRE
jgi:hypothetical protein